MPIYNLDDDKSAFDDVKITMDGITLTIPDVGKKEFDRISSIAEPYEQLAAWAGVPVKDILKLRMRRVAAALNIIAKEFIKPALGEYTPKKE